MQEWTKSLALMLLGFLAIALLVGARGVQGPPEGGPWIEFGSTSDSVRIETGQGGLQQMSIVADADLGLITGRAADVAAD